MVWAARALGPIPPGAGRRRRPPARPQLGRPGRAPGRAPRDHAGPHRQGGAPLPEPIAALWRDGALTRIDLAPLTVRETGRLLAAALGAPAEIATVRRLHHTTGGNLRLITELLPGTAMIRDGGVWRWDGELTLPPRLRQLLEAELAGLTPAETTAIELVALTEPVDLDVLLGLADHAAVALLERRGLITVVRDTSPPRVRLACPLHAHVVRERATTLGVRDGLALIGGATPRVEGLSAREAEVARLASWNLTNREIADWLVLSPRTVANHLCRVYTKLGVNNRADLAPCSPPRDTYTRVRMKGRSTSSSESTTVRRGAAGIGTRLSTAMTWQSAAVAAATPFGESSHTTVYWGSAPSRRSAIW